MHARVRAMAPSFVVTVLGAGLGATALLAACQGKTQPETIAPEPHALAKPDATVEPPKTATRKRKRTGPASAKNASGIVPWAELEPQNPKDASGRTIYVAQDDVCFVKVPMKNPPPVVHPGMETMDHVPVDCPASMDDPAWDSCNYTALSGPKASATFKECYCLPSAGNPPPPPQLVACPKK